MVKLNCLSTGHTVPDMQEKLQECAAQEEQAGGEADRVETVMV